MATMLGVAFCIVCVFLIIIILLQRGRGGGLSGAFGGAGGQTPFGAKTGDVFTWITVVMTAVFLLLTVMLNFIFVPETYKGTGTEQPRIAAPADNASLSVDQAQPEEQAQPSPTTPAEE